MLRRKIKDVSRDKSGDNSLTDVQAQPFKVKRERLSDDVGRGV